MKAQHTPGPWEIANQYVTANSKVVAVSANHHNPVEFACDPASLENNANLALIAAAPDLLAALEELLIELDKSTIARCRPGCNCAISKSRSALAKAKGE